MNKPPISAFELAEGISAFQLAQRFVGVKEIAGTASNPLVLTMLKLDDDWPQSDAVPWCSAFVNLVCWLVRLPRSKSLAARSWLAIGHSVSFEYAVVGDIVVLQRDGGGHVGFFAGFDVRDQVLVLGGNQSDQVNVTAYPLGRVLGIRRIARS